MLCGIDPGKNGAIALLYTFDAEPDIIYVEDMPAIGKEISGSGIYDIFTEFRPDHVFLEATNAFGMGRQSSYNFGQGIGVLKGVMSSLLIPHTTVSPSKWKG